MRANTAVPPKRFCVFCGSPPVDKNKEHVLPQWLLRMTGDPRRVVKFGMNFEKQTVLEFSWSSLVMPSCTACNERFSELEADVKPIASLSFVAEYEGRVVGTVRYWPIEIGETPALMLGPIAVVSSMQGQGIALALMQTSLAAAAKLGHRAVVLVGDEPYYGRAGFKRIEPRGRITMPGPVDLGRLLGLSLVEGALEGMKGEMRKA